MKAKKDNKQIVGYVRSAVNDDDSVKKQISEIEQYCLTNNQPKPKKTFIDNGCSGANLQRPALKELLTEVEAGEIERIICVDAGRLTRSIKDHMTLKMIMEKNHVEVRTVKGISAYENQGIVEEILACVNALNPRLSVNQRKLKPQEQHISVDKQNRFKRLV